MFNVDAYQGEIFRGRIAQIRLNPTTISNVVTYTAVIQVENPELKLMPSMTANVTILVAQRDNALKIPNAAIRFIPPQSEEEKKSNAGVARTAQDGTPGKGGNQPSGQANAGGQGGQGNQGSRPPGTRAGGMGASRSQADQKVWVLDAKNKLKPVSVKLGITDGIYTELLEGQLQEGDRVVVGQQTTSAAKTGQQRPPGMSGGRPPGGGGR